MMASLPKAAAIAVINARHLASVLWERPSRWPLFKVWKTYCTLGACHWLVQK